MIVRKLNTIFLDAHLSNSFPSILSSIHCRKTHWLCSIPCSRLCLWINRPKFIIGFCDSSRTSGSPSVLSLERVFTLSFFANIFPNGISRNFKRLNNRSCLEVLSQLTHKDVIYPVTSQFRCSIKVRQWKSDQVLKNVLVLYSLLCAEGEGEGEMEEEREGERGRGRTKER